MSTELTPPTSPNKPRAPVRGTPTRPLRPLQDPHLAGVPDDMLSASDHGVAQIAAAALDHALRTALAERLDDDGDIANGLVDYGAPLSSFPARADLAYLLRIISVPTYRDLQLIESALLAFASHPRTAAFDHPGLQDLVGQISCVSRWRKEDVRKDGAKAEFAHAVHAYCVAVVQDASCVA